MERKLYIYENWSSEEPLLLGRLFINNDKFREVYSFEFDNNWLKTHDQLKFDPDIEFWEGRQYLNDNKPIFGFLADTCPDTWGRMLMDNKEAEVAQRHKRQPKALSEADYLIRVDDTARMGAIRIAREKGGRFISDNPVTSIKNIRELESAAINFDRSSKAIQRDSINQLFSPGSSLGGAWPKASVTDTEGSLWIAKFPSKHDNTNREAWEMVCHDLAKQCGINVPETRIEKYSKYGSTFLTKRFDRNKNRRIHFASAMTLLGKTDGDNSSGYIDIASIIKASGCNPIEDLKELYTRMIFNMCINNTDDHLRNHGFLLSKNGWTLSPAYDLNAIPFGNHLNLMISENNNAISEASAIYVAKYFNLTEQQAKRIITKTKNTVKDNWSKIAKKYGLTDRQIAEMKPAFHFCLDN